MRTIFPALVFILSAVAAHAVESIPGVTSHYQTVELGDGSRLQAIIAYPDDTNAPLQPLVFTQWVSCGSLEYREGSNAREVLAALARDSGLALVRVERDALDGTGPTCADLDYDTELEHYVQAFVQLFDDPRIDASRVFVYGSSLGSTTAPLVAHELEKLGFAIGGVMVQGGGGVTYLERMLNFERNYLERRPESVAAAAIHDEMLLRTRFQYEYLVAGRHPDDIAGDGPEMARIRTDILGMGESDQYGRPYAWHQQAARHNFLAAWAAIDAPVLVIFNEFDQYEIRHGHKLIVDTVNRARPGTATVVERANIGHSDNRVATVEDAYAGREGTPTWQETAVILTRWLEEQT